MFSGRPTIERRDLVLVHRFANSRSQSLREFDDAAMVSSGVAMRRSTSDSASPMVFVPRSAPIKRSKRFRRAGRSAISRNSAAIRRT
jgi:hypothetical protein